ncbi:MAG: hypothetical protein KGJ66_04275 [Alphaproteobacteria bacterium]|nr:hypothetical protein [Alphaproteobacteria bacterium]
MTLAGAMVDATNTADELEFAIKRGEASALARQGELEPLREAQEAAEDAADEAMFALARFPARTLADAAAKTRFVATHVFSLQLGPRVAGAGDTLHEAFVRGVALDLNRLAAG